MESIGIDDGHRCKLLELLRSCARKKDLLEGARLHSEALQSGSIDKNPYLANTLIAMYVKCGAPDKAREVLQQLPIQNVVSWNALISGYTRQGRGHEAMECFDDMQSKGICPNELTFACALKACGITRAIDKGKQIHDEIAANCGLLKRNALLGNALVDMYTRCGLLANAQLVLEALPNRNVVSWNTLISGYVQHDQGHKALHCFARMQNEGFIPDGVTFTCMLKACASVGAVDKGAQIHEDIIRSGLMMENPMLGNAVVDMYAKCGLLAKAKRVLGELPVCDIVSWNALISGHVREGQSDEALDCFARVSLEGLGPSEITFACILKACSSMQAVDKGKRVHSELIHGGFLEKNIVLSNALLDMYAKCSNTQAALHVLLELPVRDVVSWNTLIAAYSRHGRGGREAMDCFMQMQREGIEPNEVTFACLLHACGAMGAIEKGEQIHDEILGRDMLRRSVVLGTALVDMYAKCGALQKSHEVIEELRFRDIVCWSALIAGHAREGQGHKALECFERMQNEGVVPDEVTFVCILNACSHSGNLTEAETHYEIMSRRYGIMPRLKHYTCMLVILGCAGFFDKAISLLKTLPCLHDPSIRLTLLGACRKWKNVKLGRFVLDHAVQLTSK